MISQKYENFTNDLDNWYLAIAQANNLYIVKHQSILILFSYVPH